MILDIFLGEEGIKLWVNYTEYKIKRYAMVIEMCISNVEWRLLRMTAALQRVERYLLGIISQ